MLYYLILQPWAFPTIKLSLFCKAILHENLDVNQKVTLVKSTSHYIIVVVEYSLMIKVTMTKSLLAMVVTLVNMM
jgi:hypothetical protein